MNYYEELAVSPDASTEEIREAYRQLARLLHPDRSLDERSRRLAETQMRRLNAIVEVLSNAAKRQQYDLELRCRISTLARTPETVAAPQRRWNLDLLLCRLRDYRHPNNAWIVACTTVVLALFWTFRESLSESKHPPPSVAVEPLGQLADSRERPRSETRHAKMPELRALEYLEGQIEYWRRHSEQMRGERDAAIGQVSRLESSIADLMSRTPLAAAPAICPASPPAVSPLEPAVSEPMFSKPAPAKPNRASPAPVHPNGPSLAGAWHYIPASGRGRLRDNLYSPEFIECVVVEDAGALHGRYRARYRVPDRAISPDVAFQFTGKEGEDSVHLPWTGPGGAKGEVRLRLLNPDSLEVAWVASHLGTAQGLGSGTATLVRRREP